MEFDAFTPAFQELMGQFTPLTLSKSVSLLNTNEPLVLTNRLGTEVHMMDNDVCMFEVINGAHRLAPAGYSEDPPTPVHSARSVTPYMVHPPQISLVDRITAAEYSRAREAGQNPINMDIQDKNFAFNQIIAYKQRELLRMLQRRLEWMFAQTLNGGIQYKSDAGREFKIEYPIRPHVKIERFWNSKETAPEKIPHPIHDLRFLAQTFKEHNNELAPNLILMGGKAGTAFLDSSEVEGWMKSPGVQLFNNQTALARNQAQPIGVLQGSELFEYSSSYQSDDGKVLPYIPEECVFLTHTSAWRLYYGPIYDFDAGMAPLVKSKAYSKMKISQDGKALDLFLESHPLPVLVNPNAIVRARVVN